MCETSIGTLKGIKRPLTYILIFLEFVSFIFLSSGILAGYSIPAYTDKLQTSPLFDPSLSSKFESAYANLKDAYYIKIISAAKTHSTVIQPPLQALHFIQEPAPSTNTSNGNNTNTNSQKNNLNPIQNDDKIRLIYPISRFSVSRPDICLTFDDGYDRKSVETALNSLRKAGIKSTFFVIGDALHRNAGLWKLALKDGHEICNHTASHATMDKISDEAIRTQINTWEASVKKVLGEEYLTRMKKEFPYFRLPYGSGGSSKRVLKIIGEMGYVPFGWSAETYSTVIARRNLSKEPIASISEAVAKYVVGNVKNGSIILLHFTPYDTYKLDEILEGIKKKKLNFKLISEMYKH